TLFLVARRHDALESMRSLLACPNVIILSGDLLHDRFIDEIVRKVEGHGGINLLINNAGTGNFSEFAQQPVASIHQTIGLNLSALVVLTQRLLPQLPRSSNGNTVSQIVNIGSSFAYIGYPGFAVYCASKYAVRGFTQALSRELFGSGIAVRLFSPRATKTELNTSVVQQMNHDLGVQQDDPASVAQQFLKFLASRAPEIRVGFPEKLYAVINQIAPGVVGRAIVRQLPRIRQAFAASRSSS
ncbi:MAG: hypothetical protein RLZZ192_1748, partial [Pseudomonadota bacterium]